MRTTTILGRLAVGAALALALAGCNQPAPKRVGVVLSGQPTAYEQALRKSLEQAAQGKELRLDLQDAGGDAATQAEKIRSLLDGKVNALLIEAVDSEAAGKAVIEANSAHVPVFTVGTGAAGGQTLVHVGLDEQAAGMAAADLLRQAAGTQGQVAIVFDPRQGNMRGRMQALRGRLSLDRRFSLMELSTASPAQQKVADLLAAHPGLKAIYAADEALTQEVVQAAGGKLAIVGTGGPDMRPMVAAGTLRGAVIVPAPELGEQAAQVLQKYFRGETLPGVIALKVQPAGAGAATAGTRKALPPTRGRGKSES